MCITVGGIRTPLGIDFPPLGLKYWRFSFQPAAELNQTTQKGKPCTDTQATDDETQQGTQCYSSTNTTKRWVSHGHKTKYTPNHKSSHVLHRLIPGGGRRQHEVNTNTYGFEISVCCALCVWRPHQTTLSDAPKLKSRSLQCSSSVFVPATINTVCLY